MGFDLKELRQSLIELYGAEEKTLEFQFERYSRLADGFEKHFGEAGNVSFFSVSGRIELIGNHTDHNNGKVIAAGVNLDSVTMAEKNNENVIRLYSENYNKLFVVNIENLEPAIEEKGTTNALIRGVVAGFGNAGYGMGGFNAAITSLVPPGSGVSSSASFEILIATILNHLFNNGEIEKTELAKIGQYAENVFFGKPCGLMDQIACAEGGVVFIDFQNPDNPEIKKSFFDFEESGYKILIVKTKGGHENLTVEYAAIPAEMKLVARQLGKEVLREINAADLIAKISELRKAVGDRAVLRALHYFDENDRVDRMFAALREKNLENVLSLIRESGDSSFKFLQNIYSNKEIEKQEIALSLAVTERFIKETGKGACRVHGGGFAGTILVLLPRSSVKNYRELLKEALPGSEMFEIKIRKQGAIKVK